MARINRIQAEFDDFCRSCFRGPVSKHQLIDLRRTFFGGVAAFLAITGKRLEDESVSEEQALTEVLEELRDFNEDVKAGRA